MKVMLINPPIYNKKVADSEDYLPPLGLGYIATSLKENGIDVKIVDAVNNNLTVEEIIELISKEAPDFIGTNIFSINYELVKQIIEQCKTKTSFIVGGKSTKFLYNDIVNFNSENEIIVTIGEGELITPDIVSGCVKEPSILGACENRKIYRVDGNSIYLPRDISKLKLDRTFFENRDTINAYGKIEEAIVTSRECLYNCAFCGGARSLNKDVPVRERSTEDIIAELEEIKELHPNTQSIRILDDLFLKNRQSIEKAIEIFKQFPFEWRAMAHIRSFKDAEDLLPILKECGCKELEVGIESGNNEMRNKIHKIGNVSEVFETVSKIMEAGINVKGYFMYGLPEETLEQCQDTYLLACRLFAYSNNTTGNFRTSAFQFRPYHGTELYNLINQDLKYSHNDSLNELEGRKQFNFTAGNFSNCSQEEINKFVIKTNQLGERKSNDEQNIEL